MPKTREDIENARSLATEVIEAAFNEKILEVAQEQIRLALEAKNEGVRMKAGQKIIEHVKGGPTQRLETRSASVRIVTHMPVPGFEVEPASPLLPPANLQIESGVTATPARKSLPKFRAASSPATGRSSYGGAVVVTNVKSSAPLPEVGDGPSPRELPSIRPK